MAEVDKGFMTAVIQDNKYVFSLLEELSKVLENPNSQSITVLEFYSMWKRQNEIPAGYNINTYTNLVRFIYSGISVPKDTWYNEISEDLLSDLNGEWGIEESDCYFSDGRKPKLRECIRRIRNAVAHAKVEIIVPGQYFAASLKYDQTAVKFVDDKGDSVFQAILSVSKVITLVNKLSEVSEVAYKKELKARIHRSGIPGNV